MCASTTFLKIFKKIDESVTALKSEISELNQRIIRMNCETEQKDDEDDEEEEEGTCNNANGTGCPRILLEGKK